jgi:hypothetical protein
VARPRSEPVSSFASDRDLEPVPRERAARDRVRFLDGDDLPGTAVERDRPQLADGILAVTARREDRVPDPERPLTGRIVGTQKPALVVPVIRRCVVARSIPPLGIPSGPSVRVSRKNPSRSYFGHFFRMSFSGRLALRRHRVQRLGSKHREAEPLALVGRAPEHREPLVADEDGFELRIFPSLVEAELVRDAFLVGLRLVLRRDRPASLGMLRDLERFDLHEQQRRTIRHGARRELDRIAALLRVLELGLGKLEDREVGIVGDRDRARPVELRVAMGRDDQRQQVGWDLLHASSLAYAAVVPELRTLDTSANLAILEVRDSAAVRRILLRAPVTTIGQASDRDVVLAARGSRRSTRTRGGGRRSSRGHGAGCAGDARRRAVPMRCCTRGHRAPDAAAAEQSRSSVSTRSRRRSGQSTASRATRRIAVDDRPR